MTARLVRIIAIGTILLSTVFLFSNDASAQRRDYMTDEEIELVRDAQEIDLRIDVLTTAIDRRFEALKVSFPELQKKKSDERWGAPPTGSRIQLLDDIKRLLQKAIDDIDDVASHKERVTEDKPLTDKQKKKEVERFPTAVRHLAAAAQRYQQALRSLDEKASDPIERGPILASLDFCEQIIEAVGNLGKS
jgi:hypothetical protein